MSIFAKVSLFLLICLCMQSTVYADCPDGQYYCPLTGNIITYGNCFHFPSCNPCDSNYKKACNKELHDRWMTNDKKIQKSSLSEITLPGAHDAGMGKITSCSDYANSNVTKTQDRSILQMLNSGIRYFDIRPIINHDGKMYLGHYSWIGRDFNLKIFNKEIHKFTLRNEGCLGYSMDEVLDDVHEFVSSSSSNREVIILKISHFMDFKKYDNKNSHFDKNDFELLSKKIINKLNRFLVKGNTGFLKTPINKLTKNGARVVVTFDADGYNGINGIYSQKKYLNLFDEYSNKNDFDKMKNDQFKKMKNNSSSKYFVLSWTLTLDQDQAISCMLPGGIGSLVGHTCTPIKGLADIANSHIHEIIEQSLKTKKYPNVIYTDYVSGQQTKASILINRYR